MADINSTPSNTADDVAPEETLATIEDLFFAYRDFVAEPDAILAELGFGRAHHRVLHFVHHHPGMKVAVLLEILQITKQSLARVLKALIETDHIRQEEGAHDRRQRLLYTTPKGAQLADRLLAIQSSRIAGALETIPVENRPAVRQFLQSLLHQPIAPMPDMVLNQHSSSDD